jgi:hypothetical protein
VEWKAFPAFAPEARLAVLVGEPARPGPYVIRVRLPGGSRIMPHKHPEDRIYISAWEKISTTASSPPMRREAW